jgi:hypothetical protein
VSGAPAFAAAGPAGRSWTHVLLGAVRAEFRADVYVQDPIDRVLKGDDLGAEWVFRVEKR